MEMKKIENSATSSGNVVSAGYDPATQKMQVEFKSGLSYEYENIEESEWQEFEKTFDDPDASTSSHFAQTFRHRGGTKL